MKNLNKLTAFFLFILFSYGVDTFSYTYTVANMTGENVKVQLYHTYGKLNDEPELIMKDVTKRFSFRGSKVGSCLSEIRVSKKKKSGKWGKLITIRSGIAKVIFGLEAIGKCKDAHVTLNIDDSIIASRW